MPLRALLDDRSVLAPFLDDDEWSEVRQAAAHSRLQLPCCGSAVVCRVSPLGTKHFVHKVRGRCASAPESTEHLWAKAEIAAAARSLRYAVATEAADNGWRADVLATRGNIRLAFEVQRSHETVDDLRARQRRYAAEGVRGCWFVRRPIPRAASEELPVFRLVDGKDSMPEVRWRGWTVTLRRCVVALLQRRIRFSPELALPWEQVVTVAVHRHPCTVCRAEYGALDVGGYLRYGRSACGWGDRWWPAGAEVPAEQMFAGLADLVEQQWLFEEIERAYAREAIELPAAILVPERARTDGGLACPACGTPCPCAQRSYGWPHYTSYGKPVREFTLRYTGYEGHAAPHWCWPSADGKHCSPWDG